jgi:hypothetical protein
MHSAESPSMTETYEESDVAAHGGDAFDQGIRIAPGEPRADERLRWSRSGAAQRGSSFEANRAVIRKPSIVKRMVQGTFRFVVAVLIGVGATLAWQAYGDQARAKLATLDPSLTWVAPHPAAKKTPVAAAPVSATDLSQQLRPIASEIAAMRQDLEQLASKQNQLAANQGQLAQGLSGVQATQHELGLKMSAAAAPKPKPVHPQPRQLAPRPLQPPEEPDGQ